MAHNTLSEFPAGCVQLAQGALHGRYQLNKNYIMSLTNQNLLRNFYLEAGLWSYSGSGGTTAATSAVTDGPEDWHWGWESPTCELRGHMMGHWLSAAARIYAHTADPLVKAKADTIVSELARCQEAAGNGWLAAFPETFMHRLAKGNNVWAPHYTIHKLLMGLLDMFTFTGNGQSLSILKGMADWFYRWSEPFTRSQMDDILDVETGGMLESWADLYAITNEMKHRELMLRYDRRRFFDALLEGNDVLTNKHANTQAAEILGAAKVYEITGELRYRQVVEAFWKFAVEERGYLATGAADDAELWIPAGNMSRMGVGQEHCVNYNMMRLAHALLRWTGDPAYADYWERRFVNGVLAHQHSETGMIAYFLGIGPGSKKQWGSPTQHFWCCHGTLVQANTAYDEQIFMKHGDGIAIMQWMPASLRTSVEGRSVALSIRQDGQHGVYPLNNWNKEGLTAITKVNIPQLPLHRPDRFIFEIRVEADGEGDIDFPLSLRLPWWLNGKAIIIINGQEQNGEFVASSIATFERAWKNGDTVRVELPKNLRTEPLPGEPGTFAFMDGPILLAGLVEGERRLVGNPSQPESLLVADRERNHSWWNPGYYRTKGQEIGIRFIPLYEIKDETYTVYFPVVQP
ncbi:beta-L-arabinofuranosidase domain-containing protein [Paenibacillus humicola]|uniref:beta-L-arabinofuranosidase domain-containing protein n=1 Tax=Paenibacillus humicola TaxID=3110540 RepID=UPI00237A0A7E|nr:beta-L-arabinofuranosidase domain-containing protein [Paenibacillus humicola]